MAVLSDHEIWSLLGSNRLRIEPAPEPDAVQTSSVDLRLANDFTRLRNLPSALNGSVDTRNSRAMMQVIGEFGDVEICPDDQCFKLEPDQFALAWTLETITLPNFLCARVEGKSTHARLGLSIHQTAPTVHATFQNRLQLELRNAGPYTLELYPGMSICQLIIETLSSPSMKTLQSIHTTSSD